MKLKEILIEKHGNGASWHDIPVPESGPQVLVSVWSLQASDSCLSYCTAESYSYKDLGLSRGKHLGRVSTKLKKKQPHIKIFTYFIFILFSMTAVSLISYCFTFAKSYHVSKEIPNNFKLNLIESVYHSYLLPFVNLRESLLFYCAL